MSRRTGGWGAFPTLIIAVAACGGGRIGEPHGTDRAPPVVIAAQPWTADVLTLHVDPQRTGVHLAEKKLTPVNVRPTSFGARLWRAVEGQIYGQPLYRHDLDMGALGRRNVVLVATMKNRVYAFDADEPSTHPEAGVLWKLAPRDLPMPFARADRAALFPGTDQMGVLSTPAIDPLTDTLYLVAAKATLGGPQYELIAIDIRKGRVEQSVEIAASVSTDTGEFDFKAASQLQLPAHLQLPALLLADGVVYVAFGSVGDQGVWQGWVMAYDTGVDWRKRPWPVGVFCSTTSDKERGGVSQSGGGLALDESREHVYLATGGGLRTDPSGRPAGMENSLVRLRARDLGNVTAWAVPNYRTMGVPGLDVGTGAPTLLRGVGHLVIGGKTGVFYVHEPSLHRRVTAIQAATPLYDPIGRPSFPITSDPDTGFPTTYDRAEDYNAPILHGHPVWWSSGDGGRLFSWGEKDRLKSFTWRARERSFDAKPTIGAQTPRAARGHSAALLSLSADGDRAETGVLWATIADPGGPPAWAPDLRTDQKPPRCGDSWWCDAESRIVPGRLFAFDAVTNDLLYDAYIPAFSKYAPPTIADGRVFVSTYADRLMVYDLQSAFKPSWTRLEGAVVPEWPITFDDRTEPLARGNLQVLSVDDDVELLLTDADRNVRQRAFKGGSWTPWQSLGADKFLRAAALTSDRLDLFALDVASRAWTRTRQGAVWSEWSTFGDPSAYYYGMGATSLADGAVDIAVVDQNRSVLVASLRNGQWSRLARASPPWLQVETQYRPVVVDGRDGASHVFFYAGSAGSLYHVELRAGKVGPATAINAPSYYYGEAAIACRAPGTFDIVSAVPRLRDADSQGQLQHTVWSVAGGGAANPAPFVGVITDETPTVVSLEPDRLDVFVRGRDDVTGHLALVDGSWTPWEPVLGGIGGRVMGVKGANRIELFVRAPDGVLQHAGLPGGAPPAR